MSDLIKTDKVLDLLAGVVAEIIKMPPEHTDKRTETHACVCEHTETHGDLISRKAAIERIRMQMDRPDTFGWWTRNDKIAEACYKIAIEILERLPSAEPKRVWHPVGKPPAHHKDVIVRGVEAIGNVTVHKVMQWDVDTWKPTNYAPSITWTEWSEI